VSDEGEIVDVRGELAMVLYNKFVLELLLTRIVNNEGTGFPCPPSRESLPPLQPFEDVAVELARVRLAAYMLFC
jgi:hypothetical protein